MPIIKYEFVAFDQNTHPHDETNRVGNIGCGFLVASTKHLYKFTQTRDWYSNEIGFRYDLCRWPGLMKIVLSSGANEYVE